MRIGLFTVVISSLLILLLGYTAASKLLARPVFESQLHQMPFLLPGAAVLSWLVPLSEIVIVLLLLFKQTMRKGLLASMLLLSLFTLYLVVMLLTNVHLPCSCGGVVGNLGWTEHVIMNMGLVVMAWIARKGL